MGLDLSLDVWYGLGMSTITITTGTGFVVVLPFGKASLDMAFRVASNASLPAQVVVTNAAGRVVSDVLAHTTDQAIAALAA